MKKFFLLFCCLACSPTKNLKQHEIVEIEVFIQGEVQKPGKYILPANSTLQFLIQKAQGFTLNADISQFDLNRILKDQDTIEIYNKNDFKIPINQADEKQLQMIRGIGKTMAKRIVEYRNYNGKIKDEHDLMKIKGMSEKKVNEILQYIRFNP